MQQRGCSTTLSAKAAKKPGHLGKVLGSRLCKHNTHLPGGIVIGHLPQSASSTRLPAMSAMVTNRNAMSCYMTHLPSCIVSGHLPPSGDRSLAGLAVIRAPRGSPGAGAGHINGPKDQVVLQCSAVR
jgi:hypothetical protein